MSAPIWRRFRVFERFEFDLDCCQLPGKVRILDQRCATVDRSSRLTLQISKAVCGLRDRRHIGALMLQQYFSVGPALAFLADKVFNRYFDIFEVHLVDFSTAVNRGTGLDLR